MKKKILLLAVFCSLCKLPLLAQLSFMHSNQTIELHSGGAGAGTTGNNAAVITVGNQQIQVLQYRFEFADNADVNFSLLPTNGSTPPTPNLNNPNPSDGWWVELPAVSAPTMKNANIWRLEVGKTYRVRIFYQDVNGWHLSTNSPDTFSTSVTTLVYNGCVPQGTVDVFTNGFSTTDPYQTYSYYRYEFSTTPDPNFNTSWSVELPVGQGAALGAAIPNLEVDQAYYVRVRVKTRTMTNWSDPGYAIQINTRNNRYFYHCLDNSLNIKLFGVYCAQDPLPKYANYLYEFCTDASFQPQNYTVYSTSGLFGWNNYPPRIHTAMPTLPFNSAMYARVKVKTSTMSNWSTPGPVCAFTTAPCVPDNPNFCPSYGSNCTYAPINYYSFDNDCDPWKDCIQPTTSFGPEYDQVVISDFPSGKVGTSFAPLIKPNYAGTSFYNFPAAFPTSYNGDYTVEFGFKLGLDEKFILYGMPWNSNTFPNNSYVLPHFELTSNRLYVVLNTGGVNANNVNVPAVNIDHYLTGIGVLSPSYYFDNNWHHAAMKYNKAARSFELFIDGQSPPEFKKTLTQDQANYLVPPGPNTVYRYWVRSSVYKNYLDEMAFYDKALPDTLLYQHYLNFINQNHYNACNVNTNLVIPPANPTSGAYDPLEYVPGYAQVLNSGNALTYSHCDLASIVSTSVQIKDFPLPRFKPGHGLNPNINWTDTKYMGLVYTGNCGSYTNAWDADNDVAIQTELCKNWNYMLNLSDYANDPEASKINSFANSSNYKISKITNIYDSWGTYTATPGYTNDINTAGLNLTNPPTYNVNCNLYPTLTTQTEDYWQDNYELFGRMTFKRIIQQHIEGRATPLTKKIDYLGDNTWESRITEKGAAAQCVYQNSSWSVNHKNTLAVPTNTIAPNSNSPTWEDYCGDIVGTHYKTYREAIMSRPITIYTDANNTPYNGSSLFNGNAKFNGYLITGIAADGSGFFENYNTKRICNSVYNYNNSTGTHTTILSTPNFYPWSGPYGWFYSGGSRWGLDQLGARISYEVGLGDQLYAPFVSARWSRDVTTMRPGQYLGFLKALAMYGVDFFHAGYFNETGSGGVWPVKRFPGDPYGFANDPKTWVWQLATTSYAQAISTRYESFIKECDFAHAISKYGNEYYVVNKGKGPHNNKYLVFGTIQTISNYQGAEVLSKDITLNNFSLIPNFKINARRQGSVYMLDMSSPNTPVFYQLDKWHEYTHPSYWSKDFNFEAEVDDSGNNLDLKTERPQGVAQGDFTTYTTSATLPSSKDNSNNLKFVFTPRDQQVNNNNYLLWIRMKAPNGTNTTPTVGIKLNNTSTFVVSNIQIDGIWRWYAYESCNCSAMQLNGLSPNDNTITVVSGDGVMIDQVCLKKNNGNPNLNWQNSVSCLTPAPAVCNGMNFRPSEPLAADSLQITSVAKDSLANSISNLMVKPNPMNNSCVIYSRDINPDNIYRVSLMNTIGVEVKKVEIRNANSIFELNTSDIANGMYNLIIHEIRSGKKGSVKIIVQHE